ncbi:MAG: phage portal protein [Fuerstiella sp.]|nr:phage portal protein [Fuerstiella sp.]MCP4510361.1 phage portal protein [Fuerstiella sp.]
MTSIKDRIQSAFRGLLGVQPPVTAVRPAGIQATFDLAQTTVHNRRHWANADSLAARASMSPAVRAIVRKRSRHEFDNNSWYSGILRTAANHIVGCGPRLQVLTTNHEANTRLEKAWVKWSRQVMLADKLRMMFETYWKDGEVFAMRTSRPSRWPISLDIRTFEAEQCAAPWIGQRLGDPHTDDGIRTDPNNNEIEYHFYDQHPGDVVFTPTLSGKWFPDKDVVHLFRRERPGQVRGIPRATSALNTLPVMRRQEMATLLASETATEAMTYLRTVEEFEQEWSHGKEREDQEPLTLSEILYAIFTAIGNFPRRKLNQTQADLDADTDMSINSLAGFTAYKNGGRNAFREWFLNIDEDRRPEVIESVEIAVQKTPKVFAESIIGSQHSDFIELPSLLGEWLNGAS